MNARSDFELFERAARRHIRNHVMDRGEVPALCAVVSRGWSPRKLRVQMSLHLLPDQLGVKGQIDGMIRKHSSKYAAVCSRVETEEGHTLLFAAVDGGSLTRWQAPVAVESGIGGWERSEFRFDQWWLQDALAAVVV